MGKQVNAILKEICNNLGFVKKGNFYIKPMFANIYLTVCFNIASYQIKGHRLVAPRIGLIYDDVEKILRKISDAEWLKANRYTNTISEHIGYIMPVHTWKEWDLIEPGTNSEAILNDLKDSLQKYSGVYCRQFSNIENVIMMIEGKRLGSANSELFVRLPILYYLAGHKQKGIEFINRAFKEEYSEADILFTEEYISNYMKLPDNPLDIK
ncbi:MAG: hypothetical protein ACI3ZQ_10170 [Candidatus Cryptobacteroides sp.]